ncbi:MAG: hypothetical protein BroJett030_03540 [Alphaproteobacteria bacterium]|nr:MAG: hypothetical protein BroJett030_03540 [Alphaproteobacteria bacterium]
MFFVLSKVFWFFARPLNALLLMALTGWLLSRWRWPRTGRAMVVAAAVAIPAFGLTQLPDLLLFQLERRVATAALPPEPRGIIVLGGGLSAESAGQRDGYHFGEASDRLIKGLELKRQFPQARLIFTGGLSDIIGQGVPETGAARHAIRALYGDDRGVEFESRSRNTWENAVFVERMTGGDAAGPWLLVTSAFHMPRSLGCFRKVGLTVVPVPTDYRADVMRFPWVTGDIANQFLKMNVLVKELFGLLAYRLTGRIDALLPG